MLGRHCISDGSALSANNMSVDQHAPIEEPTTPALNGTPGEDHTDITGNGFIDDAAESFYLLKLTELIDACRANLRQYDEKLITKAFRLCYDAHKNDRRASGEPYFLHPFEVAMIVVKEISLDDISVVCALLHDVVEDTAYTVEEIREEF